MKIYHRPVLLRYIEENIINQRLLLDKPAPLNLLDCTLGEGGHSSLFLQAGHKVWAFEQDIQILEKAKKRIYDSGKSSHFYPIYSNFCNIKQILNTPEYQKISFHLILFDLGISVYHYKASGRGFTFHRDEPLDMRLNSHLSTTAEDIVNQMTEQELANLIYQFSDERFSKKIAQTIINHRPIKTSQQLAKLIEPFYRKPWRIHPATRTFQALRIAVNKELDILENSILDALSFLQVGGHLVVISYHSLEDKIIKKVFNNICGSTVNENKYRARTKREYFLLNKKIIRPSAQEVQDNPAARSAKMRILYKEVEGQI